MTINDALALLVDELAGGDVPHPLAQSFTLANVWHDLCRLAGEPVPGCVVAVVDLPRPPRPVRRLRPVPKAGGRHLPLVH